jgi:hypothetical protein
MQVNKNIKYKIWEGAYIPEVGGGFQGKQRQRE